MSGGLIAAMSALAALVASATGALSVWLVRKGQKETQKASERIDAFEIMEGLVEALRNRIKDQDSEILEAHTARERAEAMAMRCTDEASVALTNVGILTLELQNHGIQIPPLRRNPGPQTSPPEPS
jgi:hypothetical protein